MQDILWNVIQMIPDDFFLQDSTLQTKKANLEKIPKDPNLLKIL